MPVRWLQTAAGSGTLDLDEEVKANAYFRHEWLSQHGIVANRCSTISVMSESMGPTLPVEQIGVTTGGEPGETASQVPGSKATDGPLSPNQGEKQTVVVLQEQIETSIRAPSA